MNMEDIYDSLLNDFCRKGDDAISKIGACDWDGKQWACATNAHALLMIPMESTNGYECPMTYPDFRRVLPESMPVFTHTLSIAEAAKAVSSVTQKKVFIMKKCGDCDGDGNFDHGKHNYECKNCDSTGQVNGKFSHYEPDSTVVIKIDGNYYKASLIYLIHKVMDAMKSDARILHFKTDPKSLPKLVAEIGECVCLVMPLLPSNIWDTPPFNLKINKI